MILLYLHNAQMDSPLSLLDLHRDCHFEIFRRLDAASRFVARLTIKQYYITFPPNDGRGLKAKHKIAAFRCGHLQYLRLFWQLGMMLQPSDCCYLNPDHLGCLYWWFENNTCTKVTELIIVSGILCNSNTREAVQFVFEQFDSVIVSKFLPILYERHKAYCMTLDPMSPYHPDAMIQDIKEKIRSPRYFSHRSNGCISVVDGLMNITQGDAIFWRYYGFLALKNSDNLVIDKLIERGLIEKAMVTFDPIRINRDLSPNMLYYSIERSLVPTDNDSLNHYLAIVVGSSYKPGEIAALLSLYRKRRVPLMPPLNSFTGAWLRYCPMFIVKQLLRSGVPPDTSGVFLQSCAPGKRPELIALGFE